MILRNILVFRTFHTTLNIEFNNRFILQCKQRKERIIFVALIYEIDFLRFVPLQIISYNDT